MHVEEKLARVQSGRGPKRRLSVPYVLDRIMHVCRTGCQWSELEVAGGSPTTVFYHFSELCSREQSSQQVESPQDL